jgi:hypothetical protein
VTSVTVVPNLPVTLDAGTGTLTISAVVKNQGTVNAVASTMKFVLVKTPAALGNRNLKGTQVVPAVNSGETQNVPATIVTVDDDTASGTYNVQACVDSLKVVPEISDGNNCFPAPGIVTVNGVAQSSADLIVTSVTKSVANAVAGDSFTVHATVMNIGSGPAIATQTKFNLVSTTGTPPTIKKLKGLQDVGPLVAGASGGLAVTVEVYGDTAPGIYKVQACADGITPKVLAETNEDNNCNTTGKITISEPPNLTITAVTCSPVSSCATSVGQGQTFTVTSTVKNVGTVPATTAFSVKYNLVSTADGKRTDLKGSGSVNVTLDPNQTFSQDQTVKVRGETPPGTFRVEACADSGKIVSETNEDDNCNTSTGVLTVTPMPDLTVTSLTVPSPQASVVRGTTFVVNSTVKNQGAGSAGPSTTKFKLVPSGVASLPKTLGGTQAVPALGAGATQPSPTTVTVTVPLTTLPGVYVVQACADSAKTVAETSDSNNCTTSVGTVKVTQ